MEGSSSRVFFVRTVELGWTPGKDEATLVPCLHLMQPSRSRHHYHHRYGLEQVVHVKVKGQRVCVVVLTYLHLYAQTDHVLR